MAQLDPAVVQWLHARNAPVSPANYNSAAELLRSQPDQKDIFKIAEPSPSDKTYDGGLDMGPDVPKAAPKPKSKPTQASGQQDAADTGKPSDSDKGGVSPTKGAAPANSAATGSGPAGNAERTAGDLVSSNADAGGGHDASASDVGSGTGGISIAALLGLMMKNGGAPSGSPPAARVDPTGPSMGGAVQPSTGAPIGTAVAAGGGTGVAPYVHQGEVMPPSGDVANEVAGLLNRPTLNASPTGPGLSGPQSSGLLSNNNAGGPSVEPGATPRVPVVPYPDNAANGVPQQQSAAPDKLGRIATLQAERGVEARGDKVAGSPASSFSDIAGRSSVPPGRDLTQLKQALFQAQQQYGPRSAQAAKVVSEMQRLFSTLRR